MSSYLKLIEFHFLQFVTWLFAKTTNNKILFKQIKLVTFHLEPQSAGTSSAGNYWLMVSVQFVSLLFYKLKVGTRFQASATAIFLDKNFNHGMVGIIFLVAPSLDILEWSFTATFSFSSIVHFDFYLAHEVDTSGGGRVQVAQLRQVATHKLYVPVNLNLWVFRTFKDTIKLDL